MIVVIGESLVDLVPNGPDQLTVHCGGSPFNTARTLARLGQPVSFLGCISDDLLGRRLRAALSADGVILDSVISTALPTTLAFAELDAAASASYRFYTEGTSVPSLTAGAALAALPAEVEALHFSSLGLMLEPLAEAVTDVVEAVAPRGVPVALDPNIRPSLIDDRDRYLARLHRVLKRTDVVKASTEDLAWLEPGDAPERIARRMLDRRPRIVLVTRGAGDAFSAGFLAWWRERGLGREDLADLDAAAEAARFACLVASRTVERPGASPPRMEVSAVVNGPRLD